MAKKERKKVIKIVLPIVILILIGTAIFFHCSKQKSLYVPAQTKMIIIGATSGIGKALAYECAQRGYTVGITGRRQHFLDNIKQELGERVHTAYMDVSRPDEARAIFNSLIHTMGGVDIVVVNAGAATTHMSWPAQKHIVDVNVTGFLAMVQAAADYFIQQGGGHIVGISSIAALRGFAQVPVYSASKAFESNYLQGLRGQFELKKLPILITTIEPGAVDTAMYKGPDVWRATPEKAAQQMCDAIEAGKKHAYITKRWRFAAWAIKLLPAPIFYKMF